MRSAEEGPHDSLLLSEEMPCGHVILEGFQVLQSLRGRLEGPALLVVGKKAVVDQRFQVLVEHVQVETRGIHQSRLSLGGGCADYQSGNLVVASPRSCLTHWDCLHLSTPREVIAIRLRLRFLPLLMILGSDSVDTPKDSTHIIHLVTPYLQNR